MLFSKASRLILHLKPAALFIRLVRKNDLKNAFCIQQSENILKSEF